MTRAFLILAWLFAAAGGGFVAPPDPASAAEIKSYRPAARGSVLPFPRSERAAAIWTSGVCWSECGAYCAWGLAACLRRDAQGACVKLTDACDRSCQRSCRVSGGPLLPIDF